MDTATRSRSSSRGPSWPATSDGTGEELVVRARLGDKAAFTALYTAYRPLIDRYCMHLLHNPDDAADVASEVFTKAIERVGTLRNPCSFDAWLYRIAHNTALNHLKAKKNALPLPGDELEQRLEQQWLSEEPANTADAEGAVGLLPEATATLNTRYAHIFDLAFRQGLDAAAMAEALGLSVAHVHVLVSRVKEAVREGMCAVTLARGARGRCHAFDVTASAFGEERSPRMRKVVLGHVRGCRTCRSNVHPSLARAL